MRTRRPSLLAILALLLGVTTTLSAQDDPPARVARLSYLNGSVSFRPASLDDWAPASQNYPLTTGDHLWTDRRARAELRTDFGALRLGPETDVSFLNLDDRTAQIRLAQGSLNVAVRDLGEDEVIEVATPNGAVTLLRSGEYRVDVNPGGEETTVTVRRGEAQFTAAGSAVPVRPRQSMVVGGLDEPNYDMLDASPPDSWEEWCESRDRALERSISSRYVSPAMIGYEDLDTYGRWREVPDYGTVWVPTGVVVGWAPYRHGHWAWVAPWGWTWIDDAPWGFAPFHYGRWAYVSGFWAWIPGTIVARPVYAPALVAWVGGSSWHASLSIGGVGVAWFPLGPREVYVPPYAVSRNYVRQVNITQVNVTNFNITNINSANVRYVNQSVPGGVTAVSRETFVSARPVAVAAVAVPRQALVGAPVVATPVDVRPQRESILVQPVSASAVVRPPAVVMNRPVVARLTPPPAPAAFSAQTGGTVAAPASHSSANPLVRGVAPTRAETVGAGLRPARAGLPPPQPVTARPVSPAATTAGALPSAHTTTSGPARSGSPTSSGAPPGHTPAPAASAPLSAHAAPNAPTASDAERSHRRETTPRDERSRPSAPVTDETQGTNPRARRDGTVTCEDSGRPARTDSAPHGAPPKAAKPAPHKEEKHEDKKDKKEENK